MYLQIQNNKLLLLIVLSFIISCDVFDPRAEVPAYLSITGFDVIADSATQGTDKQNITDAWVYINEQLQGVYELPAKFPVIANGSYSVKIYPGIKINGISANRTKYTFLTHYEETNFKLIPGVTSTLNGKTTYRNNLTFVWLENFESQGISLIKNINSDTTFNVINGGANSFNNSRFGQVTLEGNKKSFQINSFKGFQLPKNGNSAIIMELHYNVTAELTVGIIANQPGNTSVNPLVVLNPTKGNWKKVYINFTELVNTYRSANDYSFYFSGKLPSNATQATFCLDNIKLIYE